MADEQQFNSKQERKQDGGRGRPLRLEPAAEEDSSFRKILTGGRQAGKGPTTSDDLHIVIVPPRVQRGMHVLPGKAVEDGFEESIAIDTVRRPKAKLLGGLGLAGEGRRLRAGRGARCGAEMQASPIPCPTADEGLEQEQARDKGPRPEAGFGRRKSRLRGGHGADGEGQSGGGERERQQDRKGKAEEQQGKVDERVVLERSAKHQDMSRSGGVEFLKETAAENTVIDHAALKNEAVFGWGINPPTPHPAAKRVKVFRVLSNQQRFGFAVAGLLPQVSFHRGAAVMPDKTGRAEPDFPTALLQTPADVHIIAGFAKDRIEAVDLLQVPSVKSHVAAGNVLSLLVREHNVGWSARRDQDCRRDR